MVKKLYIGNLSYSVTDSILEELFSSIGEVTSASVVTDRMTGRSRGFAFVEMADSAAAEQAIAQLNGREVEGRKITVAEARPRREGDSRGDARGGGRYRDDEHGGGRRRDDSYGGGKRRF